MKEENVKEEEGEQEKEDEQEEEEEEEEGLRNLSYSSPTALDAVFHFLHDLMPSKHGFFL